jgi:soluble lytic murein transglycosylase-like protein
MSYTSYVAIFLIFLIASNQVEASPHHYCRKYIEEAAKKTGVLPEILWAVAKTESNFGSGPWPWTVNVKGKGYYFSDKLSAKKFLRSLPKKIQYQVDVGCMQINWGYHGKGFPDLTKMINPRLNVLYAAYFLRELYAETGQWSKAVASYHSRKWAHGGQYANHVALLVKDYAKKSSSKTPASIPFPFSDPSYKGRR